MSLEFENFTTVEHRKKMLNYADITVAGFQFQVPYFCASRRDYEKSNNSQMPLQSQIFQYFVDLAHAGARPITNDERQQSIINNFKAFVKTNRPKLADVTFSADGHNINNTTRLAILDLQERMPIPFINDVQLSRDQVLSEFIQQNQSFMSYDSDRIKSPTLSLNMKPELFRRKLNYLLEQKFKRINLEWGGDIIHDENWSEVSKTSKENPIWFNCVVITRRRNPWAPFYSDVMKSFYRGVHTCALAAKSSKPTQSNKKMWLFDHDTDCYAETKHGTRDSNDTESHNILFAKMQASHKGIKNHTYFDHVV